MTRRADRASRAGTEMRERRIVAVGTTGESATLDMKEHVDVIAGRPHDRALLDHLLPRGRVGQHAHGVGAREIGRAQTRCPDEAVAWAGTGDACAAGWL